MLFIRELKKVVRSVTYILFVVILIFALASQGVFDFDGEIAEEPQPGQNYGVTYEELPELIMPAAFNSLWAEFLYNQYTTYPIGFYKSVRLSGAKDAQMQEILAHLTGLDVAEIQRLREAETGKAPGADDMPELTLQMQDKEVQAVDGSNVTIQVSGQDAAEDGTLTAQAGDAARPEETQRQSGEAPGADAGPALRTDVSWTEFKQYMEAADDLLGGGSSYAPDSLIGFGARDTTYEEAKTEYQLARDRDHFTGGYARLFCDYAGVIVLSILPVFVAMALCLQDRRAKMTQLVYSRSASSVKIVWLRYAAVVLAVMIPVFVLSYYSNVKVWNLYKGETLDYLAPLKYDLGWLLPTVMITAAVGMFLTELTGTPIAIAVQCLWWFVDMNTGYRDMNRAYGLLRLAPRHNSGAGSRFRTADFLENFDRLLANRLLMAAAALVLVALTALVYEKRRRGLIGGRRRLRTDASCIFDRRKTGRRSAAGKKQQTPFEKGGCYK